jgi:hypothetical protein
MEQSMREATIRAKNKARANSFGLTVPNTRENFKTITCNFIHSF